MRKVQPDPDVLEHVTEDQWWSIRWATALGRVPAARLAEMPHHAADLHALVGMGLATLDEKGGITPSLAAIAIGGQVCRRTPKDPEMDT